MSTEQPIEEPAEAGIALHCLRGGPAPLEVVQDWARVGSLPAPALAHLWELVEASVATVDPSLERRAEGFCRLYDVTADDLRASLRVFRYLLGRAAAVDLPRERMVDDVRALGPAGGAAELLLTRYESAKKKIRSALAEEAVLEHGKVLAGVDVRVDRIVGTGKTSAIDAPIALLTLQLREADRQERTTFYVTPEGITRLREALDRAELLFGAARRSSGGGGS